MCREIFCRNDGHPHTDATANSRIATVTEWMIGLSSKIIVFPYKRALIGQKSGVSVWLFPSSSSEDTGKKYCRWYGPEFLSSLQKDISDSTLNWRVRIEHVQLDYPTCINAMMREVFVWQAPLLVINITSSGSDSMASLSGQSENMKFRFYNLILFQTY